MNKPCYNDFFSTVLSPKGQVLFSTALNLMEEHSDFDVLLLLKDYYHQWTDPTKGQDPSPQSGRTQPGSQTYTNPQSGRTPPRVKTPVHKMDGSNQVKNLYKSTKWTNPTKGQDPSPQNGRTPPRVKTTAHEVDRPHQVLILIQVHKVDGPHQGSRP